MFFYIFDITEKIKIILDQFAWSSELTGKSAATLATLLCFVAFLKWESRAPKLKRSRNQERSSYRTNVGLFLFNSVLLSLCSVSALFLIAERFSGYGLLNHINNPMLKALVAFLSIDLLLYAWHYLCHKYDHLWLLHRVHHNDPYLNVSTAFRLHFVEIMLTNLLKALVIIAMGIDKVLVLAIETITTISIMFHHTNIAFAGEAMLSRVLIVPFLHRAHHSVERVEHDSNYGAVLSVWDRLFTTINVAEPSAIGIKGQSPQDIIGLLKFGLGIAMPTPVMPNNFDVMIAEAAYYRALQRDFKPGNDLGDWYEAKEQILRQLFGINRQKKHWLDNFCLNLKLFNDGKKLQHF